MNLTQWVQDTLKSAVAYINRDKLADIERIPVMPLPKDILQRKKKPKPHKKSRTSKKLKKAA